jgi:hypothetical protein
VNDWSKNITYNYDLEFQTNSNSYLF